jgi:hypothetical protein
MCGITRQHLRPDETHRRIRLAAEDITPEALAQLRVKHEVKPGLYQCGPEAFDVFAPVVEKRTGGHLE